jgi:ABC-type glycerol-3-phosphate transport system substrate-binding protein
MSGGTFEYKQRDLLNLVEELDTYFKIYEKEEPNEIPYEVYNKYYEAQKILRTAYIYLQRFDWLFAGDDDYESFLKRIDDDLKQLDREHITPFNICGCRKRGVK